MGEEATQYTGEIFVSVEQRPGTDEVTLNPKNTGKLETSEARPETFEGALAAMENQTLWDTLTYDGNGEWIGESLHNRSLTFGCDDSYMEKLDPGRCSAAFVLRYKLTGKTAKGTVVDKGRHADNCRGELLGAMYVLLLLKAATAAPREYRRCKDFCDNEGVIFHCNKPEERVKLGQCSDDLVRICKELLKGLPMKVYFGYVRGHADRQTPFEHLTLAQQLNIIADKLAQDSLVLSLETERHIDGSFPFETIRVFDRSSREKSVGKMSEDLARWRSEMVARTYYATKKEGARIPCENFKLVYVLGGHGTTYQNKT